jgi:hypothetical protein
LTLLKRSDGSHGAVLDPGAKGVEVAVEVGWLLGEEHPIAGPDLATVGQRHHLLAQLSGLQTLGLG